MGDLSPALLQELAHGTGLAAETPRRRLGLRSRIVLAVALSLLAFSGILSWHRRISAGRRVAHPGRGSLFTAG